jgi:hypothetical protein
VTFLLTTNRADLLEPALAARPGRVDLAAELPLPDADARRQLIRLYQGNLVLDLTHPETVIERTDGVTAAFLKELLRKAALLSCEADLADAPDDPIRVTDTHLALALDQLLDSRNQLTRILLGGEPPGPKPEPPHPKSDHPDPKPEPPHPKSDHPRPKPDHPRPKRPPKKPAPAP